MFVVKKDPAKKVIGLLLLLSSSFSILAQQKEPVDYADPMVGTSESRWMLNPGATLPFGMVQLSPDNQGSIQKYIHRMHPALPDKRPGIVPGSIKARKKQARAIMRQT
jgi:hypothetical protein